MNIDASLLTSALNTLSTALIIYVMYESRKRIKELEKYQRNLFNEIHELERAINELKSQKNTPE